MKRVIYVLLLTTILFISGCTDMNTPVPEEDTAVTTADTIVTVNVWTTTEEKPFITTTTTTKSNFDLIDTIPDSDDEWGTTEPEGWYSTTVETTEAVDTTEESTTTLQPVIEGGFGFW